jgi:hypothetical protein
MTIREIWTNEEVVYEYHGNTAIEVVRRRSGTAVSREWLIFDSVREAEGFFHELGGN